MELEGRLDELLSGAVEAARKQVDARRADPAIRRERRLKALQAALALFAILVGLLTLLAVAIDVQALQYFFMAVLAPVLVGTGYVTVQRNRNRAAVEAAQRDKAAAQRAKQLPKEVRSDFARLHQARGLCGELAIDGLIADGTLVEVDRLVEDLERTLGAAAKVQKLGGGQGHDLPRQVADLADLLVALADEAVEASSARLASDPAPATLDEARERLVSLRLARRTLDEVEAGTTTDWSTRLSEAAEQRPDPPTGTATPG